MMYPSRINFPKDVGYIIPAMVKCSKTNCRCYRFNRLHGPYYYLLYREFGVDGWKLKKEYIRREEFPAREVKVRRARNEDLFTSFFTNNKNPLLEDMVWEAVKDLPREEILDNFSEILQRIKKSYSSPKTSKLTN